ncbi:hypothetical protein GRI94_14800 [Erythrobacter jejuensis]|uniref:Uncharacterized protein n=2 Tax=Parerythrobacter jejuensis TaxID=795812 RepID=A0A845B296_9SPHN|nr:hypothetical protein [Parerythrobacter jejuensis]MXP33098.1 hypothetical protein [Parerythrobacter jejuensis]
MAQQQPSVQVHHLGTEKEPLVVIDGFSGRAEALLEAGYRADYRPGGASYPGIRALADPGYLDLRRELMMQVMAQIFGVKRGIRCEASTYSLVTLAERELSPLQRIPHYDHSGEDLIAVMHYLLPPDSGGTAFYRHRRTGFEAITPEREDAYGAATTEDLREFGEPPARYHFGDDERYEMIGAVEARVDRLILYRGRQLHSGIIPAPDQLSDNPRDGRLTINMFLFGT